MSGKEQTASLTRTTAQTVCRLWWSDRPMLQMTAIFSSILAMSWILVLQKVPSEDS